MNPANRFKVSTVARAATTDRHFLLNKRNRIRGQARIFSATTTPKNIPPDILLCPRKDLHESVNGSKRTSIELPQMKSSATAFQANMIGQSKRAVSMGFLTPQYLATNRRTNIKQTNCVRCQAIAALG